MMLKALFVVALSLVMANAHSIGGRPHRPTEECQRWCPRSGQPGQYDCCDNQGPENPTNECPFFCPANYEPVCGNDGKTYSNACALAAANCKNSGIAIRYEGECIPKNPTNECPSICPANYDPVCGNDGKTYSNACALEAASCKNSDIAMRYEGECVQKNPTNECPSICPFNYEPVCGNDGKTYSNACALEAASCKNSDIAMRYDGECVPTTTGQCPDTSGLITVCVFGPDNCLSDVECSKGTRCCSAGCGRKCLPVV